MARVEKMQSGVLFARKRTVRAKARTAPRRAAPAGAIGLCLLAGVCAVLLVARADSGHRSGAPSAFQQVAMRTASAQPGHLANGQETPAVEPSASATDAGRRAPVFYAKNIRSGLFSEPLPPPAPPKVKIEHPKPAKPAPTPVVPVEPVNPFVDWSYTGTIRMGDQMMALIENTKTHEGQYVTVGQSFLSAQVENITDQMVSLRSEGKPYMVAKSDTITVVPLDKSATITEVSQPQPGAAPDMPQGMPQGMPQMQFDPAQQAARQAMRQYMRQMRGMGGGGRGAGGGGRFRGMMQMNNGG